ncbi:uncharacterized protein Ecym_5041 [Eremothecium cymbalariae DBVPG|uniref:Uncharacterized protein n=1 Tax=Eremothecium cymbalariae (strain CBS 270.75 / DBVPG 7215 / KCTC 17166 / NRRL Y-17582) TaxID=931890 RepID=I6NCP5_ERECY|nr:hypothetical protein Ecym_5041 [Eremothecium cymbalariae DBVPG\
MLVKNPMKRLSRNSTDSIAELLRSVLGENVINPQKQQNIANRQGSRIEHILVNSWYRRSSDAVTGGRNVLNCDNILKSLTKLRKQREFHDYFLLLRLLQFNKVSFVNSKGEYLDTQSRVGPLLYNELSKALSLISHRCTIREAKTLAQIVVSLLNDYNQAGEQTAPLNVKLNILYRCAQVAGTAKSWNIVEAALKEIRKQAKYLAGEDVELVIHYGYLNFYLISDQTFLLKRYFENNIEHMTGIESQLFASLLSNILLKATNYGSESFAAKVLAKMKENNFTLEKSHLEMLQAKIEKNGYLSLALMLESIEPAYKSPFNPLISHEEATFDHYVDVFSLSEIDFFSSPVSVDFILDKVPQFSDVEEYVTFICKRLLKEFRNESARVMLLDIVLRHICSTRKLGFALLVLKSIIEVHGMGKYFVDTRRLASRNSISEFHLFFPPIARSNSSCLTAAYLFKYLKDEYPLDFKFTKYDYYALVRSAISASNLDLLHYYMYHLILDWGHKSLIHSGGSLNWNLPVNLLKLISDSFHKKDVKTISQTLEDTLFWYKSSYDQKGTVPQISVEILNNIILKTAPAVINEFPKLLPLQMMKHSVNTYDGYQYRIDQANKSDLMSIVKSLHETLHAESCVEETPL